MRTFLQSQVTGLTVTSLMKSEYDFIQVDPILLEVCDIRPYQQVQVLNLTTSMTWSTIVICAERGSRQVILSKQNTDVSRVSVGDRLALTAFVHSEEFRGASRVSCSDRDGEHNAIAKIDTFS